MVVAAAALPLSSPVEGVGVAEGGAAAEAEDRAPYPAMSTPKELSEQEAQNSLQSSYWEVVQEHVTARKLADTKHQPLLSDQVEGVTSQQWRVQMSMVRLPSAVAQVATQAPGLPSTISSGSNRSHLLSLLLNRPDTLAASGARTECLPSIQRRNDAYQWMPAKIDARGSRPKCPWPVPVTF